MISATVNGLSEDNKGVVYVRQLAVDPVMQNQGIGQKLMSTITQELSVTTKK